MNERMSRAGRKLFVKTVLRMAWRDDDQQKLTVGQVAKKMGLKSSTYLKKVLFECVEEVEEIYHINEHGIDRWYFKPYVQQRFELRPPVINGGRKHIAQWVKDFVAEAG